MRYRQVLESPLWASRLAAAPSVDWAFERNDRQALTADTARDPYFRRTIAIRRLPCPGG